MEVSPGIKMVLTPQKVMVRAASLFRCIMLASRLVLDFSISYLM